MNIQELSVGDWVHSKLHDVDTTIEYIEGGLRYNNPAVWLEDKSCYERHYLREIEPIQLTEEILQKNFPTDELVAWWPNTTVNGEPYDFHFEIATGPDFQMACNLSFVHELQHLLRLCKIDNEIVI